MIALVQILIAAVLIPASFGAPAVDASEPTPTIRPIASVTTIPTYLLSHNGTCGKGTEFGCEPGNCCSQYGSCGATSDYCGAGCQSGFGLCDPILPVSQPYV
ncbi:hypothetical protein BASA50_011376 [Batrachochytrium salamandrivorans]|uniref:Chitin-binding type-1 domain-containing protein n=1 Tax=Batrachochytrium salamandrivorans TaxID=1357716 RepID=A0ABQ8EVX0_9FUNG|nr:hypothetical protein BASA50_011376 [Batrachochytrium salamandrivorans]